MLRPLCGEPSEEMCEECGVSFENQQYIVTDFSNFKIKYRTVYKKRTIGNMSFANSNGEKGGRFRNKW